DIAFSGILRTGTRSIFGPFSFDLVIFPFDRWVAKSSGRSSPLRNIPRKHRPVDAVTEFNFNMTASTAQIVASIMGDPVTTGRIPPTRLETLVLCTCIGALLEHKI